jgi:NAD(P)-dependent dehydrogenase (short-subunit alcohol dehydrogenase family)
MAKSPSSLERVEALVPTVRWHFANVVSTLSLCRAPRAIIAAWHKGSPTRFYAFIEAGDFADTDEIAAGLLYRASPAGAFLNGKALEIDGGTVMPSLNFGPPDL